MPDSCSNPRCGITAERCPVCERSFVENAQEVCASCSPWACESCGNEVKYAYKKTKTPTEINIEVNTLMGYGASMGRCLTCEKIKALGDMGVCRECVLKKVEEDELVCKNCLVSGHQWMPDGRDERTCISCGEYRVVDEEHLCKYCYDQRNIVSKSKRCWKCQNKFLPKDRADHFCDSCIPKCFGCKKVFNPERRDEIFCSTCYGNLASHICTLCNEDGQFFNNRGHCIQCQNKSDYPSRFIDVKPHYCRVCGINTVEYPSGICDYCQNRERKCPRCLNESINVAEFICSDCKNE